MGYNTYTESARLRIEVAERLRQFPLSFFARRDLSDLTATILSDVTYMEQALSHFIPEFVGSLLATSLPEFATLFTIIKLLLKTKFIGLFIIFRLFYIDF